MAENPPQAFIPYRLRHILSHRNRDGACRAQFSPDGLLLAVASDSNPRTYIISTSTPTLHRIFTGHADRVTDLAFSSDCRFLATSSNDTTIRLWDVSTGSLVRTSTGHNGPVSCVKFNMESSLIASGSFDETVRIWDVNSGARKKAIPAFLGFITGVNFNPDGSMIVACGLYGICAIWDTATGNRMITIEGADDVPLGPVGSVMFSSNGRYVLVGSMDRTLRIWSMNQGILVTIHVGYMNATGLSTFLGPDERYIVTGSEDNCLNIWEVHSWRMVEKIEAHEAPVQSVSVHPTRNMIASAALEDVNGTVKIWTRNYSFVSDPQN